MRRCLEVRGARDTLQLPGVPAGSNAPHVVLQDGHLGYGPQSALHKSEVSAMRKKPVPALGETGFPLPIPKSRDKLFLSSSALCFSLGLTQAIHIHVTVPGSCELGRAYVHGAGGAGLSTAHTHTIAYLPHGPLHAWRGGNPARARRTQRGMTQTPSRRDLFPSCGGAQGCAMQVSCHVMPVEE